MQTAEPSREPPPLTMLREWLVAHKPDGPHIDPDLDLIETRVLDSLRFVEFFLLLEELTGREIDLTRITVDSFRTLQAIQRNFF